MAKKILITGGSGLLGQHLTRLLQESGYSVAWLGRSGKAPDGVQGYQWNPSQGQIDPEAVQDCHAIIHLAGAGVADKRWSPARKKLVLDSRTQTAQLLFDSISVLESKPPCFLSASAIGYYGMDTGSDWVDETTKAGTDYLSEVVIAWEQAADQFTELGMRVAKIRIGIVLASEGGALPKLMQPIKLGVGSPIGSGQQFMSWVHIHDVCRQFLWALEEDTVKGSFNAVAPNPVTNREITKAVAKQLKKPLWAPNVPPFVLRLAFGEMAGILLGGNRVSSKAVEESGFAYHFSNLSEALKDLLG
ncbi:MAG: TIGR01777 family oxidoreductase [Bacteroidota bacterium]